MPRSSIVRRFFDALQVRLHRLGFHQAAAFVSRWGTVPANVSCERIEAPAVTPSDAILSGDGWALVEFPLAGPLKVTEFDPNLINEIAVPYTYLDVN